MPSRRRLLSARTVAVLVSLRAMLLLVGLAGCPSDKAADESRRGDPPSRCAKAGDSCTFAPGKLGLCVVAVDGATLICQSQH